jgi:hypothetical protein
LIDRQQAGPYGVLVLQSRAAAQFMACNPKGHRCATLKIAPGDFFGHIDPLLAVISVLPQSHTGEQWLPEQHAWEPPAC